MTEAVNGVGISVAFVSDETHFVTLPARGFPYSVGEAMLYVDFEPEIFVALGKGAVEFLEFQKDKRLAMTDLVSDGDAIFVQVRPIEPPHGTIRGQRTMY